MENTSTSLVIQKNELCGECGNWDCPHCFIEETSAHTKRPWTQEKYDEYIAIYGAAGDVRIADVYAAPTVDEDGYARADASLIIAAPDLLEACETQLENWRMLQSGEWDGSPEGVLCAIENLTAVIAKAKGENAPHSEE